MLNNSIKEGYLELTKVVRGRESTRRQKERKENEKKKVEGGKKDGPTVGQVLGFYWIGMETNHDGRPFFWGI